MQLKVLLIGYISCKSSTSTIQTSL